MQFSGYLQTLSKGVVACWSSLGWAVLFGVCVSLMTLNVSANETPQKLQVVVSIPPLKFIAEDVMGEQADVRLISQNGSPHHKVMRPSDIQMLLDADLILWVGQELEQYLVRFVNRSKATSLPLIAHTSEENHRHPDEEHGTSDDHAGHSHHGHNHSVDPHLWMSPTAVQEYVAVLRDHLSAIAPVHAHDFKTNSERLMTAIDESRLAWQVQVKPYIDQPYFVYHDAYAYLERELGLDSVAVLTVNPGVKPSAKKLGQLSRQLSGVTQACVFYEPEFQQVKLDRVTTAQLHYQLLDPLGSKQSLPSSDTLQYIEFISRLVGDLSGCLSKL